MKLKLLRLHLTDTTTIGELYVENEFECFTLEDKVRNGVKIKGATAIPAGTYPVVITHSNRFNRLLPLLENVPNFAGIRIHPGNTAKDTEGCILVGTTKGVDSIGNSRLAFNILFARLQEAERNGNKIEIEIVGGPKHEG